MSTWLALTTDDLYAGLAAPQLDYLRTRLLASGQADPATAILAEVTARVRAEVRAGRRNRLDRDETLLPPELKPAATALAVAALQARVPTLPLTADQARLAQAAEQLLARVAAGGMAIARPDNPETALESAFWYGLEVLRHRPRTVSGRNLRGL